MEKLRAAVEIKKAEGYSQQELIAFLKRTLVEPGLVDQTLNEAESSSTTKSLSIADPYCSKLLDGPTRGLSCLHCNQPEAEAQAQTIVDLLAQSCLKNLAVNYLVDGTFSFNDNLMASHIDQLTANGRNLSLLLYLTNGATQRQYQSTLVNAFGTQLSPENFRKKILTDTTLQAQYRAIVERLVPLLSFAQQRNVNVYLALGLEDNLDRAAIAKLYELTLDSLPANLLASFVRNPCPGCYSGNNSDIPVGFVEEIHTANSIYVKPDSIISNDGRDYYYSELDEGKVPLSTLVSVRDQAASQNSIFILWSAERQGLDPQLNGTYPVPSERDYQSPSFSEQQAIISFLRGGL
jgi:hypothetical protein